MKIYHRITTLGLKCSGADPPPSLGQQLSEFAKKNLFSLPGSSDKHYMRTAPLKDVRFWQQYLKSFVNQHKLRQFRHWCTFQQKSSDHYDHPCHHHHHRCCRGSRYYWKLARWFPKRSHLLQPVFNTTLWWWWWWSSSSTSWVIRGEQACGKATKGQKALQQRPHVSLQASSFFSTEYTKQQINEIKSKPTQQ